MTARRTTRTAQLDLAPNEHALATPSASALATLLPVPSTRTLCLAPPNDPKLSGPLGDH